jgi:alpha-L-fucosidase 2
LPVLYFQYGRYLLISSTRPGSLPPNLQGLWANSVQTPWNGDYHLDINVQMNHWPVEVTNLPMLNEPFYALVKGIVKPGQKTARAYYDSPGWVAYVTTNPWGYTSPGEGTSWGASVSGSGWLCQVLWSHYAFTADTAYLRKIYPVIKGAAIFYLHAMVTDPRNGWLVTAPSASPENGFYMPGGKIAHICAGPTIDNQIIRELFSHVEEASRTLDEGAGLRKTLQAAEKRLPPNRIDPEGRLMEWLEPYKGMDPHHRHMSPLWGLYPGNEITMSATPEMARAARALLEQRGDVSTGWSLAWKVSLWARLHDGNHCLKLLNDLLKPTRAKGYSGPGGTYPNLLDACPPFQIDGNFGGTAGIAEMLLQSHAGYIDLLPALPDQWSRGSFRGLCVRGAGVVSAQWESHHIQSATITAGVTHAFKVKVPEDVKEVRCEIAGLRKVLKPVHGFIRVALQKGQKAQLLF